MCTFSQLLCVNLLCWLTLSGYVIRFENEFSEVKKQPKEREGEKEREQECERESARSICNLVSIAIELLSLLCVCQWHVMARNTTTHFKDQGA